MTWVFEPVRAAIAHEARARDLSDPPAHRIPAAEERLARLVAAAPEPLPTALLAQVADARADETVRCILIRVLARAAPARLAPELIGVLTHEHRLFAFAEAAVAAGQLARDDDRGLTDALRAAVDRTRGWGRQYPIVGLELAGVRDALGPVTKALDDADPAVRRHAALYLGWAGHTVMLARLDRISRRDPDAVTRRVAQEAVGRLTGITLAAQASEKERRAALDDALLPRLAMFRGTAH